MTTTNQATPLTLEGVFPGLRRLGTPVARMWSFDGEPPTLQKGIWLKVMPSDVAGERHMCFFTNSRIGRHTSFSANIDLEDVTGSTHARWWLEDRTGEVLFRYEEVRCVGDVVVFGNWRSKVDPNCRHRPPVMEVPALAELHPNRKGTFRSEKLADGRARDDVAALRLVCLHFADLEER